MSTRVSWRPGCSTALDHLAEAGYPLDPVDIAVADGIKFPTINLQGRYRTTSRAPLTGLRPLRTK